MNNFIVYCMYQNTMNNARTWGDTITQRNNQEHR